VEEIKWIGGEKAVKKMMTKEEIWDKEYEE
jgi:hypothetical protein